MGEVDLRVKSIADKIWCTYNARICAQKRLQINDVFSQLLLVWYSLLSVITGVLMLKSSKMFGDYADAIMVAFSVAVLVISLVVSNRDYRGRSLQMKLNYVKLQKLESQFKLGAIDEVSATNSYFSILDESENHSTYDHLFHVFTRRSDKGCKVRLSCSEFCLITFFIILKWSLIFFAFLLPVLMLVYLGKEYGCF